VIAAHLEPKGLERDAPAYAGHLRDASRKNDAITGSANLRDAILRSKGYPVPKREPRRRKTRAYTPVEPRHLPACCESCGSPLKPQPKLISNIQAAVAAYYKLHVSTMQSARRSLDICHPRQIAMYLASELTPKSLPVIGRQFGGRDHTTVIHAIRAVKSRMERDPEVALDVEVLRFRLAA
jgi:hypothetical protein